MCISACIRPSHPALPAHVFYSCMCKALCCACEVKMNCDEGGHVKSTMCCWQMESSKKWCETAGGKLCTPWKLSRNWAAKHGCSRGPWAMKPQRSRATSDNIPDRKEKSASGVQTPLFCLKLQMQVIDFAGARHQMTLIDRLWRRSLIFFFLFSLPPLLLNLKQAPSRGRKEGRRKKQQHTNL